MIKILTTKTPNLISSQFKFTGEGNDNFDDIKLALEIESSFNSNTKLILIAKDIKCIGASHRLNKLHQSILLNRLEINHPETFYNKHNCTCFNQIEQFDSFVDLEKFIVKPINGARGIGIKTLNREQYKKCLENPDEIQNIFKDEQKYLEKNVDANPTYIKDSFSSEMLVQEIINVKHEFRMILYI